MADNRKVTNLQPEDAEEIIISKIMISKLRKNIVERFIFKTEN